MGAKVDKAWTEADRHHLWRQFQHFFFLLILFRLLHFLVLRVVYTDSFNRHRRED
jgi:hypothetical protein